MKRLVAMISLLWILACVGAALPCLADQEHETEPCCAADEGPQQPASPDPTCDCCPHMRPSVPVCGVAVTGPAPHPAPILPPATGRHESPDPREILHVPKAAVVNG